MQKRRFCVRLCYVKGYGAYKISHQTFTMSDDYHQNQLNQINTKTNDHCNENKHKRRWRLKIIHYAKYLSPKGLG